MAYPPKLIRLALWVKKGGGLGVRELRRIWSLS